jgi:dTDP-4-dehydrorhamnose reductase
MTLCSSKVTTPIKTKKAVIFGVHGQLGRALAETQFPMQWVAASRQQADFTLPASCLAFLEQVQPDLVINAAAYTQVDLAEQESERARLVNALTPGQIAQWCADRQIPFVHVSTDYVFSGQGTLPWKESDLRSPLNVYGKTKAEGEELVAKAQGKSLIFRTSWVYDHQGKNFLRTMLRLGQDREILRVVNDQCGAPTYALDLAHGICRAVQLAELAEVFPAGIYHLVNEGEATWFEFAKAIFEGWTSLGRTLRVQSVEPILSSDFPTPARRPQNSRLSTQKFQEQFGFQLPHWKAGLDRCLARCLNQFLTEVR